MKSTSIAAALLLAVLVRGEARAGGNGEADQILVIQRSLLGNTHHLFVFDPDNGNLRIRFAIVPAIAPVQFLDGPDGELLLSDLSEIRRFSSDMQVLENFTNRPLLAHPITGLERIGDKILAASGASARAWDLDGIELDGILNGTQDVALIGVDKIVSTNFGSLSIHSRVGKLLEFREYGDRRFFQIASLEDSEFELAIAGFTTLDGKNTAAVFLYRRDLSSVVLPIAANEARGVIQLGNGNLLVTTDSGIFEYDLAGNLVENELGGPAFGARFEYASKCRNFQR